MNILFASTPATGHINPLLAITRILLAEGHEITFLTGSVFRDRIENSGAKFVSLPPGGDFDGRDILSVAPELKDIPPGPEWFRVAIERFFLDHIPAQHQGLLQAATRLSADVIVGDDCSLACCRCCSDRVQSDLPLFSAEHRFCIWRGKTARRTSLACRLRQTSKQRAALRGHRAGVLMKPSISRRYFV